MKVITLRRILVAAVVAVLLSCVPYRDAFAGLGDPLELYCDVSGGIYDGAVLEIHVSLWTENTPNDNAVVRVELPTKAEQGVVVRAYSSITGNVVENEYATLNIVSDERITLEYVKGSTYMWKSGLDINSWESDTHYNISDDIVSAGGVNIGAVNSHDDGWLSEAMLRFDVVVRVAPKTQESKVFVGEDKDASYTRADAPVQTMNVKLGEIVYLNYIVTQLKSPTIHVAVNAETGLLIKTGLYRWKLGDGDWQSASPRSVNNKGSTCSFEIDPATVLTHYGGYYYGDIHIQLGVVVKGDGEYVKGETYTVFTTINDDEQTATLAVVDKIPTNEELMLKTAVESLEVGEKTLNASVESLNTAKESMKSAMIIGWISDGIASAALIVAIIGLAISLVKQGIKRRMNFEDKERRR